MEDALSVFKERGILLAVLRTFSSQPLLGLLLDQSVSVVLLLDVVLL